MVQVILILIKSRRKIKEGETCMYLETKEFMKELVEINKIPGITYAFVSKGKIEIKESGFKQLVPQKIKLGPDTLYDMASLTKVICTTTVVLKLIEKGLVKIDKPLHDYLPEFLDEKVTIRELLTHTSDINPFIPNRNKLNKEELKEAILKLTSGDKRGQQVVYTDTGTVLLGFLIEYFFHKPVQKVFEEEVLIPLEMFQSGFEPLELDKVAPTELTVERGLIKGEVHDPKAFVLGENCGSAGLFATIGDTLHFVEMLLRKGMYKDLRFLKEETVLNLLADYTVGASRPRSLGWDLIPYEGNYLLYHTGYTGTFMIIDILKEEAFVFLSNRVHPKDNRDEYLTLRDELIRIYIKERQKIEKML